MDLVDFYISGLERKNWHLSKTSLVSLMSLSNCSSSGLITDWGAEGLILIILYSNGARMTEKRSYDVRKKRR